MKRKGMEMKLDENEILDTLKNILKKVQEDQHPKKIEVDQITPKDDLSLMGIDSLDMIAFRFALDEAFDIEIPDEDFEEKQLSNIENLIAYLKSR